MKVFLLVIRILKDWDELDDDDDDDDDDEKDGDDENENENGKLDTTALSDFDIPPQRNAPVWQQKWSVNPVQCHLTVKVINSHLHNLTLITKSSRKQRNFTLNLTT